MNSPPPHRPEGHRLLAGLSVAAMAGLLLGLALILGSDRDAARGGEPLRMYGRPLPAKADAAAVALDWVNQRFEGWFNLDLPDGKRRAISYAALGAEPDRQRLRQLVRAAESGIYPPPLPTDGSAQVDGVDLIVPVRIERERLIATLLGLKDELDRLAIDARLDLDREAVVAESAGRLLDVDRSALAIERALEGGADGAALAFESRAPRRFESELSDVRHDALLGGFEIRQSATARTRDRSFNLQLTASSLDGYVLMPGGELDFNAVVGPQDEAHGYRPADGELAEQTSQISSALHAAALFAGLDILERHPLSQPNPNIELGFDAAVAHPVLNLRLKNPYAFPVVLRERVSDERVRAEVRGAQRPHTITLVRKIDAAVPFERIEQPDDTLPRGTRWLAQRGVPGLRLHRYRIRRDGAHAVREVMRDELAPTPELIRVGTSTTLPPDDGSVVPGVDSNTSTLARPLTIGRPPQSRPRPEYLVDELLVMTQPQQLDGAVTEQRVPGRFAVPGWTKDIGAPAWISAP